MRSMRYTVYTYCLNTTNHGDIVTIGSRDKYWFESSPSSTNGEFYLFRYNDGRYTQDEHQEYELNVVSLGDCGGSADVYMETGDIILGICSGPTPAQQGGSGCSPYLYFLRPIFSRNPSSLNNLTNKRSCSGGS